MQGPRPQGPPQDQHAPGTKVPYSSPHASKSTFNPNITPAEAAARKRNNLCFHCNRPMHLPIQQHAPDCKLRLQREQQGKNAKKVSG